MAYGPQHWYLRRRVGQDQVAELWRLARAVRISADALPHIRGRSRTSLFTGGVLTHIFFRDAAPPNGSSGLIHHHKSLIAMALVHAGPALIANSY